DHVKMQCAFQKYIDNAVSKTVNLKNDATVKDVGRVYNLAYELGAKGVTLYRDGSKNLQILNLEEKKEKEQKKNRGNNKRESSEYYEVETGKGPLHIHVNYDEEGPTKMFLNISPTGTETSGLTTALGILLSKYFELGGDPVGILKHLNSIKGDKSFGFGPHRVDSIPHGIAKALRDHLIKTDKITGLSNPNLIKGQVTLVKSELNEGENPLKAESLYCPKCYSSNVGMVSGCSKPTCFDCGYSECS
ncbi:hypothetical protein K8R47_00225, partial [archaeon]|nr:hypothetical protein [archaeon]